MVKRFNFGWKKRKKDEKMRAKESCWIVFNAFEEGEFAECECCGHEQELTSELPIHYPFTCPNCGAEMSREEIID